MGEFVDSSKTNEPIESQRIMNDEELCGLLADLSKAEKENSGKSSSTMNEQTRPRVFLLLQQLLIKLEKSASDQKQLQNTICSLKEELLIKEDALLEAKASQEQSEMIHEIQQRDLGSRLLAASDARDRAEQNHTNLLLKYIRENLYLKHEIDMLRLSEEGHRSTACSAHMSDIFCENERLREEVEKVRGTLDRLRAQREAELAVISAFLRQFI